MKRFIAFAAIWIVSGTLAADDGLPFAQLLKGHAVPFKKRFRLVDVRVGDATVGPLLEIAEMDGKSGRTVILKVRPRAAVELRARLLAEKSPALTLHLEDQSFLMQLNDWLLYKRDARATITLRVNVDETPCERVKRVIYQSIDPAIGTAIHAGQAKGTVTLDSLFKLLIAEHLAPYIDNLQPIEKNHSCFDEFLLYKWIRGEQVRGFAYEKYELNPELHEILSRIAGALLRHKNSTLYRYEIDVAGYTDSDLFKKHPQLPLEASATGVKELRDPLRVFYAGCANDRMASKQPMYVASDHPSGTPVGLSLENNCELGAVRAYVALSLFSNKLGTDNATYRYGTGGIADAKGGPEANRKVTVHIRVKTGDQR